MCDLLLSRCECRYDTLLWIIRRREAFCYLLNDSIDSSKELSHHELSMLKSVVAVSSPEGRRFWTTSLVVQVLSDWGVRVSVWLHGCACHHTDENQAKKCKLKGRRAVEMSLGQWQIFVTELGAVGLSRQALEAIADLKASGQEQYADFLLRSFADCKTMMLMRCQQAWGFWASLPFSLLRLQGHLVSSVLSEADSRAVGKELLAVYQESTSKSSLSFISWHFFGDPKNKLAMLQWINGGVLCPALKNLLAGYSTMLICMQRLEAKHHLLSMSVARGRAQLPAAVISELRRRANGDLTHPAFREVLPELLNNYDSLVPQEWTSHRQLIEIVYGFSLDALHPDISLEEKQVARQAALASNDTSEQPPTMNPRQAPCPE